MATPETSSTLNLLLSLPDAEREKILEELGDEKRAELWWDWGFWSRPDQIPPEGDWSVWVLMAGRGSGKTRAGAEWVRKQIENGYTRGAFVAPTAADARDVMVEGEAGILACSPPGIYPEYEPSKRRLTWPNGAQVTVFSADEPDRLRGPSHDFAWCDELAAWRYPEAWDNLLMGLRIGSDPRVVVTTTPRPRRFFRDILDDPATVVTRARTHDNIVNLAPQFAKQIIARFEGTRLARQELEGEYLEDIEGALWLRAMIDAGRVKTAPQMVRVVVAVDPAVSSGEDSDETGIIVGGLGVDLRGYVLEDKSGRYTPLEWARIVADLYYKWEADRVVAEVNNGGDLVEANLRSTTRNIAYRSVHASRGKQTRAEPVAALYEQGRISHVGEFVDLEQQMCSFTADSVDKELNDRVDALVWDFWELMVEPEHRTVSRRIQLVEPVRF